MKHTRRLGIATLALILTMLLFAAMPTTVLAADDGWSTTDQFISVTSDGCYINYSDAQLDKQPLYKLTVRASGGVFSSFEMQLKLPEFVTVYKTYASKDLQNNQNAIFTPYVDKEQGLVSIIYSSAANIDNVEMFYVEFTVDDYAEQVGQVEFVSGTFVNTEAKTVDCYFNLGYIEIGSNVYGVKGDVDGDGQVMLNDLLKIQRSIVDPNQSLTDAQYTLADINNDGIVNVVDCQYIQNYLVGNLDSLENIGGNGGGVIDKTVVYTISTAQTNEDGSSKTVLTYTFYSDNTVLGVMELIVDGKTEKRVEQTTKWNRVDQYIDVEMDDGTSMRMFVVNADGTLSFYEDGGYDDEPMDDYIQSVYSDIDAVVIPIGSNAKALIEKLVGNTLTVVMSQSGEQTVVITEDMILYKDVMFDQLGEYYAEVRLNNNRSYHIRVCVIEDMSTVGVIGKYEVEGVHPSMEMSYITLYEDGRLMIEDYYVASYEMLDGGLIVFDMEGGDVVLQLNEKTATFYTPAEDEPVIGVYVYRVAEGDSTFEMLFTVYGTYKGAGTYICVMSADVLGEQVSVTSRAYLDMEKRVLDHVMGCNMTFDEKGYLQENHTTKIDRYEPTCMQSGYEAVYCTSCNRQMNYTYLPQIGHEMGENGTCVHCGQGNNPLDEMRKSATQYMQSTWKDMQKKYGDKEISYYQDSYNKYYNEIKSATNEQHIANVMMEFEQLLEEIRQKFDGESEKPTPQSWYSENRFPNTVNQGDDIEQYINDYVVGGALMINMSDGTTECVPFTRDMVTYYNDFSSAGTVTIVVRCVGENYSLDYLIPVNVMPNMQDVSFVEYGFNDEGGAGYVTLRVYGNGYVSMLDELFSYDYLLIDNVIEFYRYGSSYILMLDHDARTASYYVPGTLLGESLIGSYVYVDGDNQVVFDVYGEYYSDADYITVITTILGDGNGNEKQRMTRTTRVYLDLGRRLISHIQLGEMTFDENGYLGRNEEELPSPDFPNQGELPNNPTYDFEKYKDEAFNNVKMKWSEFDQPDSGYELTEEQRQHGNSILERISAALDRWEVDELVREFTTLYNQIKGIREVEWTSCDGIPYRVLEGTTMEEFLEILSRVRFVIHYTDGSEEYVECGADIFNIKRLDLNTVGEYEISWSYKVEGEEYATNGMTYIRVVENKAKGASLIGEYAYVPYEEGAFNAMEWNFIKLYDNGYAMLVEDNYVDFMEYTMNGDIIVGSYYDMSFLFEIVSDEAGNSIGVRCCRPATEEIYFHTNTVGNEETRVEVFSIDGRDFAFIMFREDNGDGTVDIVEFTCDIMFNADRTKLFLPMLDGWYLIDKDNTLTETDCDHVYGEEGYCQYCGYNPNSGNGSDDFVNNEDAPAPPENSGSVEDVVQTPEQSGEEKIENEGFVMLK